jgi:hypothetical protein
MPTDEQIDYLKKKGLIYDKKRHVFQVFIVDKVAREVSGELVRSAYEQGKIDKLMEELKHNIGHDIAGQLFDIKFQL